MNIIKINNDTTTNYKNITSTKITKINNITTNTTTRATGPKGPGRAQLPGPKGQVVVVILRLVIFILLI